MTITRESIINAIDQGLRGNLSVHAAWLEGSDAHGLSDEFSDIDLWLDVKDGTESDALAAVKSIASSIGPLDFEYEMDHPHPDIRQAFLHIADSSEFAVIDVCVQSHTREAAWLAGFADHRVKVLFDRCSVIRYTEPDWAGLGKMQAARAEELGRVLHLGAIRVRKELRRGNFLEALSYYHTEMLAPLVEILRIKHQPTKQEYGLKHVTRDLPGDVVTSLEYLYTVSSLEDIETKCGKVEALAAGTPDQPRN